jgi:hypothetical protein
MIAQPRQSLFNPLFAAMGMADFNRLQTLTALMLDDLHMGCCPRNAGASLKMRTSRSLPGWKVSITKHFWKQGAMGSLQFANSHILLPPFWPYKSHSGLTHAKLSKGSLVEVLSFMR